VLQPGVFAVCSAYQNLVVDSVVKDLGRGAMRRWARVPDDASHPSSASSHRHQADAMLAGPFEARPGLEDFRPPPIEQWVRRHRREFDQADRLAATEDS
jgi:hypothetical protein